MASSIAQTLMDQRVQKVLAFFEESYMRSVTLAEMAKSVHLSVWHLSHLFKAETGSSPARYLKMYRMQEARRLLETTFLSVKEIVSKVGIGDQSHFAKDFKKAYGLTPTQYRASVTNGKCFGPLQAGATERESRQLTLNLR
ncbi:MAG: AraC family transcriptional regulator [Pyrinomonadaceae bacterium]